MKPCRNRNRVTYELEKLQYILAIRPIFWKYAGKTPVEFACFFKNQLIAEIILEKFLPIFK